jgi:hypothetical protein
MAAVFTFWGGCIMRRMFGWIVLVTIAALIAGSTVKAQPPRPGPELEHLKQLVGTWDATIKMTGFGSESKGTMVYKMDIGGMWLVGNFKGDFGGMPFEGKGLDTYDPTSKKYVGVWVDSMSTKPMVMTGNLDKGAGEMVMTGEGPGAEGKMQRVKTVMKMEGNDAITFKMYAPGPDGKEAEMMTIHYKRKAQ